MSFQEASPMAHDHTITSDSTTETITTATAEDRLSYLPEEILHHILSFLPIKHSVRTSILSNRWRYLWTQNPILNFPLLNPSPEEVRIINHCLDLHTRPNIEKFQISLTSNNDWSNHLETWIRFATTKNVRQLIIQIIARQPISQLPEFLFSHTPLTELTLQSFLIDLPLGFKGFPSLKLLQLSNVGMNAEAIPTFLLTCPLLEKLTIHDCDVLMNLHISASTLNLKVLEVCRCNSMENLVVDAPNLFALKYAGEKVIEISFKNALSLLKIDVSFWETLKPDHVHGSAPLVTSMANVSYLTVHSWFSQFIFADYCVFRHPHIAFMNLKKLYWSGDVGSPYESLSLATFLGDCPSLQKFSLSIENAKVWYHHYHELVEEWIPPFQGVERYIYRRKDEKRYLQYPNYLLPNLKIIEISRFSGTKNEVELVSFLLDKTTSLDSMLLTSTSKYETENYIPNWKLQKLLSSLPKASLHAKIAVLRKA